MRAQLRPLRRLGRWLRHRYSPRRHAPLFGGLAPKTIYQINIRNNTRATVLLISRPGMRGHILPLKIFGSTQMTARTIILVLVFTAIVTAAHAEPNKDQHELQVRCGGERAEQAYDNENMDKSGDDHFTYLNHYNTTLDKCFYLPRKNIIVWQDLTEATSTVHRDLVDPDENKKYAEFVATRTMVNTQWSPVSVRQCYVQDKTCSSESEWQDSIKPYMEG